MAALVRKPARSEWPENRAGSSSQLLRRFQDAGRGRDAGARRGSFAGSAPPRTDAAAGGGGEHWAIIASLIETCKLNGINPQSYLTDVITQIVTDHPNNRIDELLPWAYIATPALKDVA